MHSNRHWKLMMVTLGILIFGAAIEARAFGGPGGPGGPGDRGAYGFRHFGRLVEQLLFPCRTDCVDAEGVCTDTAESTALTCATQTCETDIQTSRTDCATDRKSQACQEDVSTLNTCIQPCVQAQSAAVMSCFDTFRACLGACNPTPTPTP